jgi:ATP-binding cassette, subfamily B, multidrug efflux pump
MNGTATNISAGDLRATLQPRRPGAVGPIERARDSRHALTRLLAYLRPYRTHFVLVFGCIILSTVFGLVGPYLMGIAIDRYITVNLVAGLPRLALFMLAAYLLNNIFQAIADWIMAHVSQRSLNQLRRDLFSHMQYLPLSFFDTRTPGELMSRLTNDIDAINQAVSQNITSLLASVLSLAGILVAMFVLDIWLALASVLVAPIMFWFTGFVARSTRRFFRDLQRDLGSLNSVMEEAISGQKVIKAFRRNESALSAFRQHNREVYQSAIQANSYALLLMPLTGVLGNFFVIVLAALGGWLALHGLVSVGIIATFIIYGQNFIGPLRQLANMYNAIQAALAGAERIFEIIDSPVEIDGILVDEDSPPFRGQVCFEHVDFAYQPGIPIITDMNLEAKAGETIALVGPTGAGKTTIINLLTRFYEVSSGRITIDGTDIRDIRKDVLRRRLGLVLQDTFLFADTVLENIRFGRLEASDEECMRAARLADADHFIRQLPYGYQTNLSERAGNLSQGQRQLLAIARAILADPGILVLDEATSNVDSRTEFRIQTALLRLMERRTCFVIAHRLSTIRDADQVLVIDNGRIVEKGTHQDLLDKRGLYHHLYLCQFKGQKI